MFEKNNYRETLYQTSVSNEKCEHSGAVLTVKEGSSIQVYNFDKVKNDFCSWYRKNIMGSCDALFMNQYDNIVIEFKNANHIKLLDYMDDIKEKLIDTHMILLETFFRGQQVKYIRKNVKLLVVYNDTLDYSDGVNTFSKNLSTVAPKKGSKKRVAEPVEDIYQMAVKDIKDAFETEYYLSVDFINKTDFMRDYVNTNTLKGLV